MSSPPPVSFFMSGDIRLAFVDVGEGEPVLLLHGFASNLAVNWAGPGWIETLRRAGRRVLALDQRGHGQSDKPHDPAAYGPAIMAADAVNLLDARGVGRADVIGYSMGARIAAAMAAERPDRVRSLVLGGIGLGLLTGRVNAEAAARAFEGSGPDPDGSAFRAFADANGGDIQALAACLRAQATGVTAATLAAIAAPILVAVGTADGIAGPPDALRPFLPQAEFLSVPRRDHNRTVGDRVFKEGVLAFLLRRP